MAIGISYFDRQALPVAISAIQRNIPISDAPVSYTHLEGVVSGHSKVGQDEVVLQRAALSAPGTYQVGMLAAHPNVRDVTRNGGSVRHSAMEVSDRLELPASNELVREPPSRSKKPFASPEGQRIPAADREILRNIKGRQAAIKEAVASHGGNFLVGYALGKGIRQQVPVAMGSLFLQLGLQRIVSRK